MAATWDINELVSRLKTDRWRSDNVPFTADMAACQSVLFDSRKTRDEKANALSNWLSESQPCRFGQMEAKQKRLRFCILTDNDLEKSDQHIATVIEDHRAAWKGDAFYGLTHGFLICLVSQRIAYASPDNVLLQLARRVLSLYVGADEPDVIHHDDILLQLRGSEGVSTRSWKVGINVFGAQGNNRWWHDHRFPGGLAFSMNSVGHMARTHVETSRARLPTTSNTEAVLEKLVFWALPKAMRSIGPKDEREYKGTWLEPHGTFTEDSRPPNGALRPRYFNELSAYSENKYSGLYHTDHSIPSAYFDDGIWEIEKLEQHSDLYFTYLHQRSDDDYLSMGLGIDPTEPLSSENQPGQQS